MVTPRESSEATTIHATAVLVDARAVVIRGPAACGKSSLALRLLQAADAGLIRFARLVGDDRVHVEAVHGVVLARPATALAGLIEVRGIGICRLPFEPIAAVGWVIDLAAADAVRLPESAATTAVLAGIALPRLAVPQNVDPIVPALTFVGAARGLPETANIPR